METLVGFITDTTSLKNYDDELRATISSRLNTFLAKSVLAWTQVEVPL